MFRPRKCVRKWLCVNDAVDDEEGRQAIQGGA